MRHAGKNKSIKLLKLKRVKPIFLLTFKINLSGLISFLIIPYDLDHTDSLKPISKDLCTAAAHHFRALFSYTPQEDLFIPCKELGISFNKGDILRIISKVNLYLFFFY